MDGNVMESDGVVLCCAVAWGEGGRSVGAVALGCMCGTGSPDVCMIKRTAIVLHITKNSEALANFWLYAIAIRSTKHHSITSIYIVR